MRNFSRTISCLNSSENTLTPESKSLLICKGFEDSLKTKDSTRAWDEKDLKSVVDALVRKGLVDDIEEGRYRISDSGLEWKESP
jgi:hypothetical protein